MNQFRYFLIMTAFVGMSLFSRQVEAQEGGLNGNCIVQLASSQIWDCKLKTSTDLHCTTGQSKPLEGIWFQIKDAVETRNITADKFSTLSVRDAADWFSCQGFNVRADPEHASSSQPSLLESIRITLFNARDQRLKGQVNTWKNATNCGVFEWIIGLCNNFTEFSITIRFSATGKVKTVDYFGSIK